MIAFLSPFPPYRGGISRFSHYFYQALSSRVACKAYGYRKLYPPLLFPGKTQFSENEDQEYATGEVHAYNPLSWKKSALNIAESKPDLFLYSNWHPFFAAGNIRIIKYLKKSCPDIKIAGLMHNVIPHEHFPFQGKLSQKLFSMTDYPVVLSSQTRNEFNIMNTGKQPVELFHPVYEQKYPDESPGSIRQKLGLGDDDRTVLFFGLIRKYKGLDVLIRALNELDLEHLNIRPVIVGEFYIPKKPLLELIRPEHRSRYIIIDRFVSDSEAAEVLSIADVMVLPYLSASQSGILSNAVNFSLPAICSDLPGLTDHIRDGENGIIFNIGDSAQLKQKMTAYFSSDMKTTMSKKMEKLKEELSWEAFTQKFLAAVR